MIPIEALLVFAGVYVAALLTPGPGNLAIVARALASGFWAAAPMAFGTLAGDLVLLTLSAFGLALAAQTLGEFFLVVKLGGAAYLIWLGYRYWTAPTQAGGPVPGGARQSFLGQFALTLGNPKAIAFFVALLPSVVDLHGLTLAGYLELCAVSVLSVPAVMLSYAALASRIRRFLSSERARGRMNKGAGLVMAGAGVGVAVT